MVDGPANTNVFPVVPPQVVSLDGSTDLFSALTAAEYVPAGFRAVRLREDGAR